MMLRTCLWMLATLVIALDDFEGVMLSHRRGGRFESPTLDFFGYQPRRR